MTLGCTKRSSLLDLTASFSPSTQEKSVSQLSKGEEIGNGPLKFGAAGLGLSLLGAGISWLATKEGQDFLATDDDGVPAFVSKMAEDEVSLQIGRSQRVD